MSNVALGGIADGRAFTYYETVAGGAGGGPSGPGASAVHTHMTNTLNTPIEALEAYYPLRVCRYAVRRGSGGVGRHRGGCGIVREIEFLAPAEVTLLGERRRVAPYGLRGGGPGERHAHPGGPAAAPPREGDGGRCGRRSPARRDPGWGRLGSPAAYAARELISSRRRSISARRRFTSASCSTVGTRSARTTSAAARLRTCSAAPARRLRRSRSSLRACSARWRTSSLSRRTFGRSTSVRASSRIRPTSRSPSACMRRTEARTSSSVSRLTCAMCILLLLPSLSCPRYYALRHRLSIRVSGGSAPDHPRRRGGGGSRPPARRGRGGGGR